MKKTTSFYLVTFLPGILTGAVICVVIFLFNTANAQLQTENFLKAPFVSAVPVGMDFQNSRQSQQSIMQNSEKDIVFIENLGQIRDSKGNKRPDVLFLTRSQGVDMYITSSGITYVFRGNPPLRGKTEGDVRESAAMRKDKVEEPKTNLYRLDMEFVRMNKNIKVKKELAVEQQFNYYTPEYPDGISPRAYKKITLENIYDGIDLVYYEKEDKMKYDFIVKAGADPRNIKMKYKGAGTIYLNKDGSVIVTTPMGEIREDKPYTYSGSTGLEIESRYKVKNNLIQFNISEYNQSEDIIIDPYRQWATYYGGGNHDRGDRICTDNSGALYVTGRTYSSNFPTQTLAGAYNQTILGGSSDAFILRFSSTGARLWATYYGGSNYDFGNSIYTDNSGILYVTGYTSSTNFPTQVLTGAYNQAASGGNYDAFILKFNISGERMWATYYGGNNDDVGRSICSDNSGALYVTGSTLSSNFPTQTLPGAYNQTSHGGGNYDAFILKFNSSGARLWATYYGGNNDDVGGSSGIDNSGNLYVTGNTSSTNFPTQVLTGAYNQVTSGGNLDAFILKFNSSGARVWATYYGGTAGETGYSICTDNTGVLYVTGVTGSTDFPIQILPGAYNQTTSGGVYDVFILKFNSSGARLWASYYGGQSYDYGFGICTDNTGALYVTGRTYSTNFPTQTLPGTYNQTTSSGFYDAFILQFDSLCARQWATYYGGNGMDYGHSICADNTGALYVTGITGSTNFPIKTLPGAYNQTTSGGLQDAFILKFGTPPSSPVLISPANNSTGLQLSLNLVWSKPQYALSYRLQVSTNSSFTNLIVNDSTLTDTIKAISGLTPSTYYWWRVNAKNLAGTSPYSSAWKFRTLGYPTQVNLLYPPDDTTNIPVNINFKWNKASDQTLRIDNPVISKYWYELTADTSGTPLIVDSTLTDTTKSVSGLNNLTSYYWRVKAKNQIGWGNFSVWFKFTTIISAPAAPVLVSPVNGATLVATNPLLDWDSSATAESYRVQVSTDSGFTSTVYDSSGITITEFQIPNNGLNINTTYYWRVNAANAGGTSPYSTIFHFTTGATNISGNNEIPKEFKLYNNYPNPFNPTTNIKFDIPKPSYVKIITYNVLGKEIITLVNEKLSAGSYEVDWNAFGYPSGVYFYKLITDEFVDVKKMVLLK